MKIPPITRSDAWASSWLVLKAATKSFGANRNLETAATLAFYGFLSLMPLLLLTLLVLRFFVQTSGAASTALGHVVGDLFPAFNLKLLDDLEAITGGGALGLVGGLLLFWSMTPLSSAFRTAMARIFKMPLHRPFLKSKVMDLVAVLSFLLLFLVLVAIKLVAPIYSSMVGWWAQVSAFFFRSLIPFALSVGFVGIFFRIFSPVRLNWRQMLLGAVCVTLLWAVMRNVFVIFLQYNPNYGYAFGSLKAIFLLIVWVHYSFAALLLGAEIMANTYRRDALLLRNFLEPEHHAKRRNQALLMRFERVLAEGETLFSEGESGAEMFVVLEGAVRLSHAEQELAVMKRGQFFGEMSLLGNAPRSATATAVEATRLVVIKQNNFDLLVRENPVLVHGLLQELARRLTETNRKLENRDRK